MLKKLLAILAILTITSCGTINKAVDHAADRTELIVTHTTKEIGKLKTEVLNELEEKIDKVVPKAVETALNTEAVAFLIVSITFLLGLVVVVALVLVLGMFRTLYRRIRHPKGCSARQ